MAMPPEHAVYFQKGQFPVHPTAAFDDAERGIVARYGHWMEALATGKILPVTAEQSRFVQVACGEEEPESAFEIAWAKQRWAMTAGPRRVGPLEVSTQLERLQAARATKARTEEDYEAKRTGILAQVRTELDALDAEFADRLQASADAVAKLDADTRAMVLAFGASVRHAGVWAVYAKPRTTWDTPGLTQYMQSHPEVAQFRKVGKPTVSLRYEGPPPA